MGGISPDGTVMWWGGRYNGVVYAMSTADGRLLAKIPVGSGPHGLCLFPQPGRVLTRAHRQLPLKGAVFAAAGRAERSAFPLRN